MQLLVSGSISVAMHQFLTTSSLGEPVLPDSFFQVVCGLRFKHMRPAPTSGPACSMVGQS